MVRERREEGFFGGVCGSPELRPVPGEKSRITTKSIIRATLLCFMIDDDDDIDDDIDDDDDE